MAVLPAMNETKVKEVELWVSIASACIVSAMTPIGLIGNSLVVLSVTFSNKLRYKTNAFVVSLAATDLLTCAFFPVQVSSILSQNGPPSAFLCEIAGAIMSITLWANLNILMLIAVNRWFKIIQSATTYSRVYSQRNMVIMIVLSWVHPCLFSIVPAVAGVFSFGYIDSLRVCYLIDNSESEYIVVITIDWVNTIIFTAIILGAYINIAWVIHKKRRQVAPVGGRDVAITQTLAIVVFVFLVGVGSYAICDAFARSPIIWIFSAVLLLSTSVVNPFIYSLKHPGFRQTFRCIITCRFKDIPEPSRELRAILRFWEDS